jgi:hypothetical protein
MATYDYSLVQLASLIIRQSKEEIYEAGLGIATALELPVSSWQAGDPTRSLYHLEAETLSSLEESVAGYIESGFLDYATGDWLKVIADQGFNVQVPAATFATTEVVLTNEGGGVYEIEAGDLTLKSTISGKTYRNTSGGTLAAKVGSTAGTLTIDVIAEEAGSDSSAGAGEIDDMVTTLLGVTCSNEDAAIGIDEQDEEVTRQQCRDALGNVSPNGPREIYAYVARNPELSGTTAIARVRVYSSSDSGDVTVYLAGPSGAVEEADRALVEEAFVTWATPLCTTVETLSVSEVVVPVSYEIWLYKSSGKTEQEAEDDIESALEEMFRTRPIGGDIIPPETTGKLYLSMIESVIRSTFPKAFRVRVTAPAADLDLALGEVAALGTITATINLVVDP